MREPASLDDRIAAGRAELLSAIDQPPLARIGRRAVALRRRRRAAVAAGALVAVLAVGVPTTQPWWGGETAPPPVAGALPSGGPVYAGAGITINGLVDARTVMHLPGMITDIEFVDADHGYLVTGCAGAAGCQPAFAGTADGGQSWTRRPLPPGMSPDATPDIVAFREGRLALFTGDSTYVSPDAGRTWTPARSPDDPSPQRAERGEVLAPGGPACPGSGIEVWSPEHGSRGPLAKQPELAECSVVPTPVDGTWWAGGSSGEQPAVAVTRDGGRTWSPPQILDGPGAARVSAVGQHAYAVVTGVGRDDLRAVYHSVGGGAFTVVPGRGVRPATVSGEPVLLLDGRLLIVSEGRWYVSTDDGASFTRAEGDLPWVGRLTRTTAGYVAHNLFGSGWAAFSSDGATWRKFPVRPARSG